MVRFIINNFKMYEMYDKNLHSNMVRFIISTCVNFYIVVVLIYIPIWLDLLCITCIIMLDVFVNLHSNMVRFIIFEQ